MRFRVLSGSRITRPKKNGKRGGEMNPRETTIEVYSVLKLEKEGAQVEEQAAAGQK